MAGFQSLRIVESTYAIDVRYNMIFVETHLFTRRVKELLDDDAFAAFQMYLVEHPEEGDIIEGTGGLRKIRVAAKGHGKRGGARVIYYYFISNARIALLTIFPKNEQRDLTADERKALKRMIEHWK